MRKKKINRMDLNYMINTGMLILFVPTLITGIIKFPGFLPLIGVSVRRTPIPMQLLTLIHDWAGLGMAVLVLLHVILHWKMSIKFFKSRSTQRRRQKKIR